MKAIIISDDKVLVDFYKNIFTAKKIDIINYKWLLKAMDNVEEIKPDFIIVNTFEYPRHWKILSQFLKSGIAGDKICFILHSSLQLENDELLKAKHLLVDGIITSTNSDQVEFLNEKIDEFILNKNNSYKNQDDDKEKSCEEDLFSVDMLLNDKSNLEACTGYYIISHPASGKYITGKYLEYNGNKITCKIDNLNDFAGIDDNCFIKYVSFYNKNECKSFTAKVNEYLDLSDEKFIVLDICDFYEEK